MKREKKSLLKKIITFFKSPFYSRQEILTYDGSIEKSEVEKFNDFINEVQEKFNSELESWRIGLNDDENLIGKIPTYIMNISHHYRRYGEMHAKVNAKDYDIKMTATYNATLIAEHIQSIVNGKIAGLSYQIDVINSKIHILEEEVLLQKNHRTELLNYANNNDNQFSIVRGWMYVIFGILLLMADIPLSLSVVSSYGLVKGFKDTDTLILKLNNTEALLFSFGIAFSAIIFKIFYDEYINTKLGRWLHELNSFKEDEKKIVIRERNIKLSIKLVVLFALLIMFYYAGIFRNAHLPSDENNADFARLVSFTLLTILIPTISGICLSIGFNNFSNVKSLKKSFKNLRIAQTNLGELSSEQQILVVKKSQLEGPLEEWNNINHKIETIASQLVNSYNQGYKNSFLHIHGYDLYKQIEDFHGEIINRRLNKLFDK